MRMYEWGAILEEHVYVYLNLNLKFKVKYMKNLCLSNY